MSAPESSALGYLLTAVDLVVCLAATGHVLLFKRDIRAATGWIGLIWLSPVVGAVLYMLLGVNRIDRKARTLLRRDRAYSSARLAHPGGDGPLEATLVPEAPHLVALSHLVAR